MKKRIRDYGIRIGDHPAGALNKLTDVPGVRVGHYTVDTEEHKTGVTVILPCEENIFASKLTAAAFVHNGFGKTAGIPQIEELGTLESPIALTNTLNVGLAADALVEYTIRQCEKDQVEVTSVSPVVGACNDCSINRLPHRAGSLEDGLEALKDCNEDDVFIIGGGMIYREFLPYCNKAYVTYIHRTFEVDTDFENLDQDENWKLESVSDGREHEGISFEFRIYRRVRGGDIESLRDSGQALGHRQGRQATGDDSGRPADVS